MVKDVQAAAYEGGSLRLLSSGGKGREAVLALPLDMMLAAVVRVPAGEDPVAVAAPVLQAANPFPDEPLTVSCETVRETPDGTVVLAAALPESSAAVEGVGAALDAAKLNVTRVDILALGQLRNSWDAIYAAAESADAEKVRKVVLVVSPDCISMFVLDGDMPVALKAVSQGADIRRETMLMLLEAEDFNGAKPLVEIVVIEPEKPEPPGGAESTDGEDASAAADAATVDIESLEALAPVRRVAAGVDSALAGIAERNAEEGTLNALPESWAQVLDESRFKAKLVKYLSVAVGIWALAMGVLFGVPVVYGFMADSQKAETRRHHARFTEVKKMVDKVNLVRKYSDREHSALELLKAVSDRLPEDVTLTEWDYRREKGISVRGDAGSTSDVYALKDEMEAMAFGEGDDAPKVFAAVKMGSVSSSKDGRTRFSLDLEFPEEGWE